MSERTRAELLVEIKAIERSRDQLRQAHEGLAGTLTQTEKRREALQGECDMLRDQVHDQELTIAHMRGRLSYLDKPEPLEPPPQPLIPQPSRWEGPSDRIFIPPNPWEHMDHSRRLGGAMAAYDGGPAPWYRRR